MVERPAARFAVLAAALAVATSLTSFARAAPRPAEPLPDLVGIDVNGRSQRLRELVRGPTLVIAITDRGAEGRMRDWFEAADRWLPSGTQRVSVVSIGVPFFVSDGFARAKAREHVPPQWREETLLDTDRRMARELGLTEDTLPWAFAVGADGQVIASAHAYVEDPAADAVFRALAPAGISGARPGR
ncbi:MAG: hypothetical protein QM765_50935 [Myxococcales bacterium]